MAAGITAVCADCGKALDFRLDEDSCTEFKHTGVRWISDDAITPPRTRYQLTGITEELRQGAAS